MVLMVFAMFVWFGSKLARSADDLTWGSASSDVWGMSRKGACVCFRFWGHQPNESYCFKVYGVEEDLLGS